MSVLARLILSILATGFVLSACSSVQPGRSMGRELDDMNASLDIKSAMLRAEGYDLANVDVEVTEGVALLTGEAARNEDRFFAECMAWSSPSVRSVANEIDVGEWSGRGQNFRDSWITQQLRSRLLQDRSVRSLNFNIETRRNVVYLLGYARSEDERTRAATHASLVRGVEEVVDLTRIRNEQEDLPARGELAANACNQVNASGDLDSATPEISGPASSDFSGQSAPNSPEPIDPK